MTATGEQPWHRVVAADAERRAQRRTPGHETTAFAVAVTGAAYQPGHRRGRTGSRLERKRRRAPQGLGALGARRKGQ